MKVIERDGRKWDYEGFFASMHTIGPPGTVIYKSDRAEPPKYIQEERKETKREEAEEKRRRKATKRR